jgi:hypothetical protein
MERRSDIRRPSHRRQWDDSTLRMFDVADVGDARICLLACDGERRREHAQCAPSTAVRTIGTVSGARISLLSSIDSKRLLGRIGKRSQRTISFFRPTCAGTELDFPDDDSVLLNGRRYVTATAQ